MPEAFGFVVRTPHGEVLRSHVLALRVPAETGSVGVLAHAERAVLAIEPGLVIARGPEATLLVGTAGGLLRIERDGVTLLSPLAVVRADAAAVRLALDEIALHPSAELALRQRIDQLERGLLSQSQRRGPRAASSVRRDHAQERPLG